MLSFVRRIKFYIPSSRPQSGEHQLCHRIRKPCLDLESRRRLTDRAIFQFCYVGDDADGRTRTLNALFRQLIDEPCFDTLRTKEQLGYLVHSSTRSSPGMTGFRIAIQSEREAPFLEERIEAFLNNFEKLLEDMPEEQFEKEKTSLANRLREDYKNLHSE